MIASLLAACGGRQGSRATPDDPFSTVPIGSLPLASLSGTRVLLLTVGGLALGDSTRPLPQLEARRTAMLAMANAALDTAVRRDGREVDWMGVEEQRRAARRNPTLGLEPDRFATALLLAGVERVPDPLFGQLRSIAAITSARFALVPAAVKIAEDAGAFVASYVVVVVDARTGAVRYRARAVGPTAATPEAALAVAASHVIAAPVH